MDRKNYDVVVLGGSHAGYLSALKAAKKGLKTALVEENRIGGIETMASDMPLANLLKNDQIIRDSYKAKQKGINFNRISFEPSRFYSTIEEEADKYSKKLVEDLKENGVDLYIGQGVVSPKRIVTITRENAPEREIQFKDLIYAKEPITKIPDKISEDLNGYYTAETMGLINYIPETLLIYGKGVKAIQAALVWSLLGSDVKIINEEDRILTEIPEEIEELYRKELLERGVTLHTGIDLLDLYQDTTGAFHAEISDLKKAEFLNVTGTDLVVLTGKEADRRGLDDLNLTVEDGFLKTNNKLRTDNMHILTFTASEAGQRYPKAQEQAAEFMTDFLAGQGKTVFEPEENYIALDLTPPFYAIGVTDKNDNVYVAKYPEEAHSLEDTWLELYLDKELGYILGAVAMGEEAKDIIAGVSLLMRFEGMSEDLLEMEIPEDSGLNYIKEAVKNYVDNVEMEIDSER